MASDLTATALENAIRSLINAEATNLGIEVTLPVVFGDGELVTVVVEPSEGGFLVHDAGFSAMRLSAAGVTLTRGIVHRLSEFARRYRCSMANGRVTATATASDVAEVACLVANASRAVADYVYELRRHAENDFRALVFDSLKEIVGDRIRETEEFTGKSGRRYRVSVLLDAARSRPQTFVSALANRQVVPQNFAMFFDLGAIHPEIERDAVYDDTADIRVEDRALLSSAGVETIGFMEAQRRFREMVKHASH
jgi:hypothetical protein